MRFERVKYMVRKNSAVKRDVDNFIIPAEKNKVNLNAWIGPGRDIQNVGDYLSQIVLENVTNYYGIDLYKKVKKTKHLYAIGSILLGYQDATIWGSGFLNDPTVSYKFGFYSFIHKHWHTTDVRAVRGPESRRILMKMGIECPEIYGDPAILMPLFYEPKCVSKEKYVIIPHFNEVDKYKKYDNVVSPFTSDYKGLINTICSSNLVISSSLHGIILAESYGIPAVMLKNSSASNILKYKDYYESTGRNDFVIVDNIQDAFNVSYNLPDEKKLSVLRKKLLEVFPIDLWE